MGEHVSNNISLNPAAGLLVGDGRLAQRACILSGSMGAVAALRRFFTTIDTVLPVTFIVVIPAPPEAVPLFCDLIARNTTMRVLPALTGHVLRHGEVIVVPSNRMLQIDEAQQIQLLSIDDRCSNPVDEMMKLLAHHFRQNLGAIMFSGLGLDGRLGCGVIEQHGGEVWTQSKESCQFHRLPHGIARTCAVKFTATPENLAVRIQSELRVISRYRAQQSAAAEV